MDPQEKNIDESWKDSIKKDEPQKEEVTSPPQADFKFFITTLGIQASIFMGVLENPATGKTEENLPQAKFMIDTLDIVKEKTKGNLTSEESTLLENILYELKMLYVNKSGEGKP